MGTESTVRITVHACSRQLDAQLCSEGSRGHDRRSADLRSVSSCSEVKDPLAYEAGLAWRCPARAAACGAARAALARRPQRAGVRAGLASRACCPRGPPDPFVARVRVDAVFSQSKQPGGVS